AEIQAEPVDGLLIDGSVGYVKWDGENTITSIPDWTASGGIQYEILADGLHGSITPRLDWFYVGKVYYSNLPEYMESTAEPAYSTFNGRITYHNVDHDFDVAVGATNLFNKFYYRQKI